MSNSIPPSSLLTNSDVQQSKCQRKAKGAHKISFCPCSTPTENYDSVGEEEANV